MRNPVISEALLGEARTLSSATLHEAGGKIGALPSAIRPIAPDIKLCGRALPVHCTPGDNLFLHHAIYAAHPGDVLVVDTQGQTENGYWGEIMAVASQVRGIAGLVITGGVRDSARMTEIGFPVFSQGICIRGTEKDPMGPGQIGAPVTIGDITVCPGDLVFGDDDGVVVIPASRATEVVEKSIKRDADEQDLFRRLRGGETTLAIYHLPAPDPERAKPGGRRRSINVDGLAHGHLPIPNASRIGDLVATGGINGKESKTGTFGDVDAQATVMFANLRAVVEAAGGTTADILKLTIWIAGPEGRAAVNGPWIEMFPDEAHRPARHVIVLPLGGGMLVQCEALAVIRDA